MNEREFANKIKQDLNYGTGRLSAKVTTRLKQAREQALEVFAAQRISQPAYASAGHPNHHNHHQLSRKWLPYAMITLAFIGALYWQQEMTREDNVDVALLSSEVPLNSLVDHNFQAWLEHSLQH